MNLTPIQKLLRLKAITRALCECPPIRPTEPLPDATAALLTERDAILSTVGSPPLWLAGEPSTSAWVDAFVASFPTFDRETAELWFDGLATGAAEAGRVVGRNEGMLLNAQSLGMPRLVATLELVRDGLKSGAVKSQGIVNVADPAGPRRPLVERIVEDLAAVGVTQ